MPVVPVMSVPAVTPVTPVPAVTPVTPVPAVVPVGSVGCPVPAADFRQLGQGQRLQLRRRGQLLGLQYPHWFLPSQFPQL